MTWLARCTCLSCGYAGRVISTAPLLMLLLIAWTFAGDTRGEVENVRFTADSTEELVWDPQPDADEYGVYRGKILGGESFEYNHTCWATELPSTHALDRAVPWPGDAIYYLVVTEKKNGNSIDIGPIGLDRGTYPLPCGPRVFLDADATGAGDGSSWEDAYTTMNAALRHPYGNRQSLTIWIRGSVPDDSIQYPYRSGRNRFRGGFFGTEDEPWDRDDEAPPSQWSGTIGFDVRDGYSGLFERLEFLHSVSVEYPERDTYIAVVDSSFQGASLRILASEDWFSFMEIYVESSRFHGGRVELTSRGENGKLTIRHSEFDGGSWGGCVRFHSHGGNGRVVNQVLIVGNTFSECPGAIDMMLDNGRGYPLETRGIVSSNVIRDSTATAIRMGLTPGTKGCYGDREPVALDSPHESWMRVDVVNNTIVNSDGSGIRISCEGSDWMPSDYYYHCDPRIWNNILAGNAEYGVSEGAEESAEHVCTDPDLAGNDFYGNGHPYLDEGTTTLETVSEVNDLPEAHDNVDEDPRFINPLINDYHLSDQSPLIDLGMALDGLYCPVDMDGQPRTGDGNGDGRAWPDIGADEAP